MTKKKRKYLKYEEKYLLLKNHFQSDISLQILTKEFDVSLNSVYSWLRKIDYDFENIERLKINRTLKERKTRIKLELSDDVKKEILELISKHPTMGALKIKQYFFRHRQVLLSEKKIYFYLKAEGIIEGRRQLTKNRNLKNEIFSSIGLNIGENTNLIKGHLENKDILKIAKQALEESVININENIVRPKHGTTPINVLKGYERKKCIENNEFKKEKQLKRKNKRPNGGGSFKKKINKAFNKIADNISIDKIFAIDKLMNNRLLFLKT